MTRAVRYNFACSLDGFIATPTGSYGWIVDDNTIDWEEHYAQFKYFVMGRKTYETYEAMGPVDNPLRKYYGTGQVIVVSGTLDKSVETQVEVVKLDDLASFVKALKEKEGDDGDIWLVGGGKLAGLMLRLGLVDTVEPAIMPVVLGEGLKTFDVIGHGTEEGWKLDLRTAERKVTGIVILTYKVVYGSSSDGED
ncbi:dihydrofolate reductase-like domain-containing protein [Triangularia verruculosa]|uniref:2,5-diamino-6-ribosylamino-4(3H)-pyrimidinone 5'-phosphate reductase n=1 Tax=Triangularia verruculosa TaxID=2587418 RepID=A0AAN7ASK8_9PEZI|nr:dihydrofolate reductase-like domain-containing protein [Triangularia verruculosa]